MENLQQAGEKICELHGSLIAVHALLNSLLRAVPASVLPAVEAGYLEEVELERARLLGQLVSAHTLRAFEHDVRQVSANLNLLLASR